MGIYCLVICFIILFIGGWFFFKKDIIQPAVIYIAMYTVSVICCMANIHKWGVNIHLNTFLVLTLGALHFALVCYFINLFFFRKYKLPYCPNEKLEEGITKNKFYKKVTIILVIYNIIIIVLLIYNVYLIASNFGEFSGFSEMLTIYKDKTAYHKVTELPNYLTILMKPIIAGAYIYSYVFSREVVKSKNIVKAIIQNSYMLIFPIIYIIQRICESNRGSIMNYIVSGIVMYIIIWYNHNKWEKTIKVSTLFFISIGGIVLLIAFYFSASIIGRINTKGLVDYITYYLGGSIECFNLMLQENIQMGEGIPSTFYNFIRDLNKFPIFDFQLKANEWGEFRYYEGVMIGNIYTGYSSAFRDFGYAGLVILQTVIAIIFSWVYGVIKYCEIKEFYRGLIIIIYSYLIYTIAMHPMFPTFFEETLTIATMGFVIFFVAVYCLVHWEQTLEEVKYFKKKVIDGVKR